MIGQHQTLVSGAPPPTGADLDDSLEAAHRYTRASYQLNANARPGWHVGYFATKGLCLQTKLDLQVLSDQDVLEHIQHRPDEWLEVLRGIQAYRQEFGLQLQKVLSKSEMPHV